MGWPLRRNRPSRCAESERPALMITLRETPSHVSPYLRRHEQNKIVCLSYARERGRRNDMKIDTPVFIVGGGPVGLAMALLLDRFGVDCVVAERDPATTEHPKSRGCFPRTMELFRQWGIEDAIRAVGLPDKAAGFSLLVSIAGHE